MIVKKNSPLYGIGAVTILLVVLTLSLTAFTVLALNVAQADLRLSEANAAAVSNYYAADSLAAHLQAAAERFWPAGERPAALALEQYLQDEIRLLTADMASSSEYQVSVSEAGQGLLIALVIEVREYQSLYLELYLGQPTASQRWQVWQWQTRPKLLPLEAEPLPVWQGGPISY